MSWRRRARRNVARVRRYPRRGVLPKVAPANPAETSVAKVPNTPDGQFALWPGQDPNVHRLGFYEFEIEATSLDQALWAAELPTRQSPFLIIELSTSELKVVSETKDVSFVISSTNWALSPTADIYSLGMMAVQVDYFENARQLLGNRREAFQRFCLQCIHPSPAARPKTFRDVASQFLSIAKKGNK